MSQNYAKALPRDKGGEPMQEYPAPALALARYSRENAAASSVMTFTDNTTAIEVAAVGGTAVMRWVASSDTQASVVGGASGANYDHVIPTNTVRRFVIPVEGQGTSSIVGMGVQAGLYRRVAVQTTTVASVLTSEY